MFALSLNIRAVLMGGCSMSNKRETKARFERLTGPGIHSGIRHLVRSLNEGAEQDNVGLVIAVVLFILLLSCVGLVWFHRLAG